MADSFASFFVDPYKGMAFPDALKQALTPAGGGQPVVAVKTYSGYRGVRVSSKGVKRPLGFIVHWTAGRNSRDYIIRRELVQLYIREAGTVEVLSDGRTGHPGHGNQDVLNLLEACERVPWARHRRAGSYNSDAYARLLGVEVEDTGIAGKPTDWAKWDTAWAVAAACCRLFDWPATSIIDHAQWTARKVDTGLVETRDPKVLEVAYAGAGESHTGQYIEHAVRAGWWLTKLTKTGDQVEIGPGSTGPEVEKLQVALNRHGANLIVDGDFGPATADMLRNFQRHVGILPTTTVTRATWAALLWDPDAPPAPPQNEELRAAVADVLTANQELVARVDTLARLIGG